jgi:hypothetical protein
MLLAAQQAGDLSSIAREDLSQEGVERDKDGLSHVLTVAGFT